MAKISKEELAGFNSLNGFRTCTICGQEHLTHGGCWCGGVADIAICNECSDDLLHLYFDTMLDDTSESFNQMSKVDKKNFILNTIKESLEKKFS